MKIYHKFLLYQNKWIYPYVRVALRVMTTLTYLASILLIVGLVYEHGFRISAAEAHQLQRLYHGVWIVFLADISLHIALEYKDFFALFDVGSGCVSSSGGGRRCAGCLGLSGRQDVSSFIVAGAFFP